MLVSNIFLLLIVVLFVTLPEILDTHAQMLQPTRQKNISHNRLNNEDFIMKIDLKPLLPP